MHGTKGKNPGKIFSFVSYALFVSRIFTASKLVPSAGNTEKSNRVIVLRKYYKACENNLRLLIFLYDRISVANSHFNCSWLKGSSSLNFIVCIIEIDFFFSKYLKVDVIYYGHWYSKDKFFFFFFEKRHNLFRVR